MSVHKDQCSSAPAYLLLQAFVLDSPAQYGLVWNFVFFVFFVKVGTKAFFPPLRSAEFISFPHNLPMWRYQKKKVKQKKERKPFPDMPLKGDAWLLLGALRLRLFPVERSTEDMAERHKFFSQCRDRKLRSHRTRDTHSRTR